MVAPAWQANWSAARAQRRAGAPEAALAPLVELLGIGGLLARLLIASASGLPDRFCAWRRRYPVRFAASCGFVVALIGFISQGAAVGGGHHHTRELLTAASAQEHAFLT